MKKQILIAVTIFLFLFWKTGTERLGAQSFSQEVIGSAGMYSTSANGSMTWTIGEVMIETYSSADNFFTQGFHQPDTKVEILPLATIFFIPEGFSPNGDGINDLFVIKGLDMYPHNSIVIFNRWGDKVFEASPYQNTWDGKSMEGLRIGGDILPISTYFYLFDLGNGSNVIKGSIYLNR